MNKIEMDEIIIKIPRKLKERFQIKIIKEKSNMTEFLIKAIKKHLD